MRRRRACGDTSCQRARVLSFALRAPRAALAERAYRRARWSAAHTPRLPPCRDLATNWNIDVAHDLEEYLEELADVEISFDGGKTSLNFAQAALLIQGSACIYSRKVEYLYTLIDQTLDMITTQSRRGKVRVRCRGASLASP